MNKSDNSGSAFPIREDYNEREGRYVQFASDGLSIRDYFAAKAMQGMLSDPTVACDGVRLARIAYSHADAMIAERNK